MNFRKTLLSISLFQLLFVLSSFAQPSKQLIDVVVVPTQTDWTYKVNESISFKINILKDGQLLPNAKINYKIGPEQMPATKSDEIILKKGSTIIKGGKMKEPGFLRCHVTIDYNGKTYYGWGTAGIDPEKIEPLVKMPEDFDAFWDGAKKELAQVPMDAMLTLKPELCTAKLNVYHVNLQNIKFPESWTGNSRVYGMLTMPKKPGKYPAILGVPGAGVYAYGRDDRATENVIVFNIGIHGIPVDLDPEIYSTLGKGALSGYQKYNLENKDAYYYKRVYLGCIRAIDFIESLPEYDGTNLGIKGGSQGGALSIVTASLDERVKYLVSFYPALSDLSAYNYGRAGGWPHMFKHYNKVENPNWETTTSYYDVVNFSKNLKIPGWYSWGYNDHVCPPSTLYAAYNSIKSSKELHVFKETQHWAYPEQWDLAIAWLHKNLNAKE